MPSMLYNNPTGGTNSTIGSQIRTDYYDRRALIEAVREQFFLPLSDSTAMPANYGKTIKRYHYLPLLDERNVNDQGIDASGANTTDGNLYGGSRDVGTITGKLPAIGEQGGRVSRVGFTRVEIEGTIEDLGFFDEWTRDSINYDSDSELYGHVSREMIRGASEISEDALQIDLLNGAGTLRFGGAATEDSEVTGEGDDISVLTYAGLRKLSIDLDLNRTPQQTQMLTGSGLTDTRTVNGGRIAFISAEMQPTIEKMRNDFNEQAFIPAKQYATQTDLINGEIGSVGKFRFVVNPEMMIRAGEGADATVANAGYATTTVNGQEKYDIHHMLVIGAQSFVTIGFQTRSRGTSKFEIIVKQPSRETADRNDPFGRIGFMSIQWNYGTMILREERIALYKVVAEA